MAEFDILKEMQVELDGYYDGSVESFVDDFCAEHNLSYECIEETDWEVDYKYQYHDVTIKIDNKYYSFSESRSGSPFTDWDYNISYVCEINPQKDGAKITININGTDEECKEFADQLFALGDVICATSPDMEMLNHHIEKVKGWK